MVGRGWRNDLDIGSDTHRKRADTNVDVMNASNHPESDVRRKQQQIHAAKSKQEQRRDAMNDNNRADMSADTIYEFYRHELVPMLVSSVPILFHRLAKDVVSWFHVANERFVKFVMPSWTNERQKEHLDALQQIRSQFSEMIEQSLNKLPANTHNGGASISDFILEHFDANRDGHISPKEVFNMTDIISALKTQTQEKPLSLWVWFSREWPLMDWKIGVFLWRTFGGILLVLCILSIIPGRLHSTSGKVLRWPILGLTYFLITVELCVYIVIRLVIRIAEALVATPRHRALRKKMAQAKSYDSWFRHAAALDVSQKRDVWQNSNSDETSYRYNWSFIRRLIVDLRGARHNKDSLLAIAVLQQCTRKNVGGIMSEDLFSYTNTGEPKKIVRDFCSEVVKTLRWVTDEAKAAVPDDEVAENPVAKQYYEKKLTKKVRGERNKLWKTVIDWTTMPINMEISEHDDEDDNGEEHHTNRLGDGLDNESEHSGMPGRSSLSRESSDSSNDDNVDSLLREDSQKSVPLSHHPASPLLFPTHKEQLIHFLKRARAAYGRTALCLSGGSMMGMYHFGHLKGLMETDCLPNIISGTSAGSVVGAVVCTRTDEELRRDMRPDVLSQKMKCFRRSWPDRFRALAKTGAMFDVNEWRDMIRWFTCGDMTFEEAYKKTGRVFCITLSSTTKKAPPVLLNYISAPDVVIASAVVASAAVPGFVAPVQIQYKDADGTIKTKSGETYFDGSIRTDIPAAGLAEMLNCQFFVACQCNPHVVPFFFDSKGGVGRPNRWSSGDQVSSWRGGFLLAALEMYLKNDMKAKFVFLNDLEAAIGFTSTMMVQEFGGSTTIVPQVKFSDFFKLISDPTEDDLRHAFQGGAVAAYRHASMIRLHYSIADALDECLESLEGSSDHLPDRASFNANARRAAYKDWAVNPPAARRSLSKSTSMVSTALASKFKSGYCSTSDDDSYS